MVGACPEVQRDSQVLLCEWRRVLLHRGHQPALLQVSDLWGWARGKNEARAAGAEVEGSRKVSFKLLESDPQGAQTGWFAHLLDLSWILKMYKL